MPGLKIELAPANMPVTLGQTKDHMRVTLSNDDDLITTYIQSATDMVEKYMSRSLINKGYLQALDHFPRYHDAAALVDSRASVFSSAHSSRAHRNFQKIKLLRSPLIRTVKIDYIDPDGALQTLYPTRQFESWEPGTEYVVGEEVLDPNGNVQQVAETQNTNEDGSASSGLSNPDWADNENEFTSDGQLSWQNKGEPPEADFVEDLNGEPPTIYPMPGESWPATLETPNAVRIHFIAGYGETPDAIPAKFKTAVMIQTSGLYEFREPVSALDLKELPWHLRQALRSDKVDDFAPTPG